LTAPTFAPSTSVEDGGTVMVNSSSGLEAPQIRPWEVRVGDVIGASGLRYTVKLIGGPQATPKQWTFFGRDDDGRQHTSTFGEGDLVSRFAKAS
jgi:hypothetical protein